MDDTADERAAYKALIKERRDHQIKIALEASKKDGAIDPPLDIHPLRWAAMVKSLLNRGEPT